MKAEKSVNDMHELEEMAVRLEATVRKLPMGPDRDELLRNIAEFRAQLVARLSGRLQATAEKQ